MIETNEIGNEIRYKLKDPEDVFILLIRYDKSILAEAFGRFLEYFEYQKWGEGIDASLKGFYDVFPHPYRV